MKKTGKFKINYSLLKKIDLLVLVLCVYSANARCCWLAHQPKMPDEVKKFKRF